MAREYIEAFADEIDNELSDLIRFDDNLWFLCAKQIGFCLAVILLLKSDTCLSYVNFRYGLRAVFFCQSLCIVPILLMHIPNTCMVKLQIIFSVVYFQNYMRTASLGFPACRN